ncbi:hypothetical protein M8828_05320 [Aeromonas simiae]|uniref:hypothetical protein n=1 Tax=Aeromonas simiae TaxID=218936 RepID=UPI00266BDA35|nr:hypothetical protein [Aeromonas simiae]MDO2947874.1 hypothetical protein [Aeromonas simiae]MDO2955230.1 hypothetical protein [Aeromonas simiae]
MQRRLRSAALLAGVLLASHPAFAYSYAAAGKEPLIDARELLLKGGSDGAQSLNEIDDELAYLEEHHKVALRAPLKAAVAAGNSDEVTALLNRAYRAEIERRLEGARQNLGDYQSAKVLVVKSKRFLDLVLPALDEAERKAADQGISDALKAIGNPGVFGVGAAPADEAAFKQAEAALMQALAGL